MSLPILSKTYTETRSQPTSNELSQDFQNLYRPPNEFNKSGDSTKSLCCEYRLKPMLPISSQDSRMFSFKPASLSQKLEQESDCSLTGYWHHQFQHSSQDQSARSWCLGLLAGKAIFSDRQPLSVSRWFAAMERYVPRWKSDRAKLSAMSDSWEI